MPAGRRAPAERQPGRSGDRFGSILLGFARQVMTLDVSPDHSTLPTRTLCMIRDPLTSPATCSMDIPCCLASCCASSARQPACPSWVFFFCRYLDVGAGAESGGPRCLLSAPGFGPSSGGVPGQDMLLHTIPAGRDPEFRDVVGGARPWLARSDYDVVRRAVYGRIARGGLAAVLVLSLARSRAGSLRPQGRGYAVTPPGSSQVLLGFASGQFPLHVPLKPELFDSRNPCDLESLRAPRSGPRGVHPHLCSPQVLLIA